MYRERCNSYKERQALAIGLLVLATTGISGCADTLISKTDLHRITAAVEKAIDASPCDGVPAGPGGPKTIDIEFTEQNGVWCPSGQVESCPQVFQSNKVQWRSVKKNSEGEWEPFDVRFQVYFTPFKGDAFPAPSGKTGLKNLDPGAPEGVYKYTVWDLPIGKDGHQCEPLDPNFRVNK